MRYFKDNHNSYKHSNVIIVPALEEVDQMDMIPNESYIDEDGNRFAYIDDKSKFEVLKLSVLNQSEKVYDLTSKQLVLYWNIMNKEKRNT